MRIHRIQSQGTGPLPAVDWRPDDCEVIYDDNQTGKTTLIDLLIDIVLSEGRKQIFEDQDRYSSFQDTTVELSEGEDRYTFTPDGAEVDLSDLLGWNLPELNRLLCVRASEVEMGGPQEDADVWKALASVLEGLEEDYVKQLRDTICRQTNITEKDLKWANNKRNNHFEDTMLNEVVPALDRAENVEDQLSELLHRREELRNLDEQLEALRNEKRPGLKEDLQQLEDQLLELDLQRAEDDLEEALSLRKRLQRDFGRVDPEFEEPWEEARNALDSLRKDQKQRQKRQRERTQKQAELEEQRDATREQLKEIEADIDERASELQQRQQRLESRRDRLVEEQKRAARLRRQSETSADWPKWSGVLAVLIGLVVLMIGGGMRVPGLPAEYLLAAGLLLSGAGILLSVWRYRHHQTRERLSTRAEELLDEVPGKPPDPDEDVLDRLEMFVEASPDRWLEDARSDLESHRQDLQERRETRSSREAKLESLEERLDELRDETPGDLSDRIDEHETTCETYRRKTGLPDFETYRERLEERREVEQKLDNRISQLKVRLDLEAEDPDLSEIEVALEQRRESLRDVSTPDRSREELEEARDQLQSELETVQETLRQREEERDQLERTLQEQQKMLYDLDVDPAHPEELFNKKRSWNRRLNEAVRDRLAGAFILRVLDSLEENYLRRVRDLLNGGEGDDRSLSDLYGTVMGDEYRVEYEPDTMSLTVHAAEDDTRLPETALSSGARTHLYLSCRLVALRRLFGKDPGFMLLDDPFLTYFPPRKRRALELLEPLLNEGWQILFFTVDPAVRDHLVEQQGATVSSIDDLAVPSAQ